MRIGIGYDIHALKKGRPLKIGGVRIPHPKGLQGHSDADVLLHAVVDAVLGAAGAGDLGDFFPDTDARFREADSGVFVRKAMEILKKKKLKVAHIDSIVLAQEPKLGPYKEAIRRSVARVFELPVSRVGVKAKTHEGFDAVGRKQAIACQAVAVLQPRGRKK